MNVEARVECRGHTVMTYTVPALVPRTGEIIVADDGQHRLRMRVEEVRHVITRSSYTIVVVCELLSLDG